MRHMLTEIIKSSKSNYRFKASTNSILIIIGTILITSPIAFTWFKAVMPSIYIDMDLTNLNYFLGGIGIVAFVSTFFNKPQKQMTISIADLAQSLLICNMYHIQFQEITRKLTYVEEHNFMDEHDKNLQQLEQTALGELERITNNALRLIDNYLEKYARDDVKKGKKLNEKEFDTATEMTNRSQSPVALVLPSGTPVNGKNQPIMTPMESVS